MLTALQYRILKTLAPSEPQYLNGAAYVGKSKVRVLLGDDLLNELRGKRIVDFGCGDGEEVIELLKSGVDYVVGIDIRESLLRTATERAAKEGLLDRCEFVMRTDKKAAAIVSIDSFEHFADPAGVLDAMYEMLEPGGVVMISFGPTWFHPLGGHLFSVVPWAHLLFSERALIRWRSDLRNDGATRFSEVEGGLNQMTISYFEQLVHRTGFKLLDYETVPIRKLRRLHNRLTREFTTAIVRAKLLKPDVGT